MKKIFFAAALAFSMAACQEGENTANVEGTADTTATAQAANVFGISVNEPAAIDLAKMSADLQGKDSLECTLKGKVVEVCQKKGCWMTIEKPDGSTMQVKFKDYALFMPKDIAGREVVMHGVAKTETVSVEDLRHYAEDAGKTKKEIEAITQPETKVSFLADGVVIK